MYSGHLIHTDDYSMWAFVSVRFHWTCSQGSPMLWPVSGLQSFSWLASTPPCGCAVFVYPRDVSVFWLSHKVMTFPHKLTWTQASILVGCIPRSGAAGSPANTPFNLLRNCQTILQSSCTNFHSHQQYMRVSVSPHFLNTCYCQFFSL